MKKDEYIINDVSYDSLKCNDNKMLEIIEEREKIITRIIGDKKKSLSHVPKGKLHISKRGKYVAYYVRTDPADKTGEYISKSNMNFIKALAQKAYNIFVIKCLETHLAALLKYKVNLNHFMQEILSVDKSKSGLIVPLITDEEEYIKAWSSVAYQGKSFDGDEKEYYSARGERVRSKSEVIIADALSRHNIPYRYEYPVRLGDKTIYPDFTCLNLTKRKNIIYEHFGMMDNIEYVEKALRKIKTYEVNGYKLGEDFIFTMESSSMPLSIKLIEHVIDHYL